MALMDVATSIMANQAMNYLATGTPPRKMGNAHPNLTPYQAFPTRDGNLILAIGNDGQFRKFCGVAGLRPTPGSTPQRRMIVLPSATQYCVLCSGCARAAAGGLRAWAGQACGCGWARATGRGACAGR